MGKTSIAWTDYSWPVVNGCRRISTGCEHCYAERLTATRLRGLPKYTGLARMRHGQPQWTGETRLWEPDLRKPFTWPAGKKVFVADMGDLLYEGVPEAWIRQVREVMAQCPHLTFQVLTKRAQRLYELFHDWISLPHVWLGVSCENQAAANARRHWLQQIPAAVRFLSCEPLLSPVEDVADGGISWVIVGGESGPNYRPMSLDWLLSIVDQCRAAQIPIFVKQASHRLPGQQGNIPDDIWALKEFPKTSADAID